MRVNGRVTRPRILIGVLTPNRQIHISNYHWLSRKTGFPHIVFQARTSRAPSHHEWSRVKPVIGLEFIGYITG